jgi:hypothetical protein
MMPPNQMTKARFSAQKTMCISYSPCSSYEKCFRQYPPGLSRTSSKYMNSPFGISWYSRSPMQESPLKTPLTQDWQRPSARNQNDGESCTTSCTMTRPASP